MEVDLGHGLGNNRGFEFFGDSIDSSRIGRCKVESIHRKSIRCIQEPGLGICCDLSRFALFVANRLLQSRIVTPEVYSL